jgi:hypothetical protein
VTALGVYDEGRDGLAEAHDVGLFRIGPAGSSELLARVTVPAAAPLNGDFRYAAIKPTALVAGSAYAILATWRPGRDKFICSHGDVASDPGIRYVHNLAGPITDEGLSYTTRTDPKEQGYFGPSFLLTGAGDPRGEPARCSARPLHLSCGHSP